MPRAAALVARGARRRGPAPAARASPTASRATCRSTRRRTAIRRELRRRSPTIRCCARRAAARAARRREADAAETSSARRARRSPRRRRWPAAADPAPASAAYTRDPGLRRRPLAPRGVGTTWRDDLCGRAADALARAMRADPRVVALGEDLGRGGIFGQYRGLPASSAPQRVIDTPISEATIMGAAVGMALTGLRPVVEMRVVDFALCAIDEIVNQAAKNRYMFGGQGRVPLVIRMPIGIWSASAAQHSQSLESVVRAHPGAGRRRARHAAGQPRAAAAPRSTAATRWSTSSTRNCGARAARSIPRATVEIGRARVRRARARPDARQLEQGGALPRSPPRSTAAARGRRRRGDRPAHALALGPRRRCSPRRRAPDALLVVHEAVQVAGFGAEIAATVAEALGIRVARLGAPRIPVGYAPTLEAQARALAAAHPRQARIAACLKAQPRRAAAPVR